jgi:flagellar hook-associated protein 1
MGSTVPSLMGIGYSGMNAAKTGIGTAGHNIANAQTPGFSRQRVIQESTVRGDGFFGRENRGDGVRPNRIDRMSDPYIEKQLRASACQLSQVEEKDLALKQLEDVFNEMSGEGLNRLIGRFFNDFRRLSLEPESKALKETVKESARALAQDFNRLSKEVDFIRRFIDDRIESHTQDLNRYAAEVADLNAKIQQTMGLRLGPPNDLMDKRDVTLKAISERLGVSTFTDNLGRMQVEIRGAGPLVTGGLFQSMSVARTDDTSGGKQANTLDIWLETPSKLLVTQKLEGGRLGGLIEVRDGLLSDVSERLNLLAYTLASAVNEVHGEGVTPRGETACAFFEPLEGPQDAAARIKLLDAVMESSDFMAVGLEGGKAGDNRVALKIAALQDQMFETPGGTTTLDQFYDGILGTIGVHVSRNTFEQQQQKDILTQLEHFRETVSGVSIDEETAQLLQMQHLYDASAKMISVADELNKTLLGMVR